MTTLPPDHTLRLILGSSSPRRRELLAQLGITPADIRPPDIDEDVRKGELPRAYVNRIAAEKAAAVQIVTGEVALCADTTVALGRRIMGKPADTDEARAFLRPKATVVSAQRATSPVTIWTAAAFSAAI
ncbi:MAG: Maf family protein, partial [Pseudomonadota bacterium]